MAVAKITTLHFEMALTTRVDENCAQRTCVQVFCELGQQTKIDQLSLTHLRMVMHVKWLQVLTNQRKRACSLAVLKVSHSRLAKWLILALVAIPTINQ